MKKRLIIALALGTIVVISCDKVEFPNIGSVVTNASCDTLFSFTTPTQSHRNVLVEDFTGHLCGNCPGAIYELDLLHDTYGDTLIVLSMHPNTDFNEVQTSSGKFYTDWKNEEAEQIMSEFDIPSSLPRLMINRTESTSPFFFFNANQLTSAVPAVMGQTPDFSIKLSGSTLADRTVCAKVEVELLNTMSGTYSVVNCLIEDSIIDYQLSYPGQHPDYTGAGDDTYPNYIHRHVMRDVFGHYGIVEDAGATPLSGSVWGDPITGTTVVGDIKQYVISSTPMNADWDENHMYIISYVYDDATKEVLQVVQTKVAP